MKKYKIYLIHGYTASSESNWFPYLKKEFESKNIEITILNMPNSQNPKLNEWNDCMDNSIDNYDENTIFIGHSLGCVTILHFLNKNTTKKIKGLFLISGFVEESPIPALLEFVQPILNYNKIIKLAKNRIVISAKDDDIINYKYSQILAEKLDSKFILLEKGKHFIDRDNFIKFPLLVKKIKDILD